MADLSRMGWKRGGLAAIIARPKHLLVIISNALLLLPLFLAGGGGSFWRRALRRDGRREGGREGGSSHVAWMEVAVVFVRRRSRTCSPALGQVPATPPPPPFRSGLAALEAALVGMRGEGGEEGERGGGGRRGATLFPLFPRPLSRTSFWLCGRPFLPPPFLTAVSFFGYGRENGREALRTREIPRCEH